MDRLVYYEEAATWLEEVVVECQKTGNVDLSLLIRNCEKCTKCVHMLLTTEEDSLKLDALSQLSVSLNGYLEILLKKKHQLDGGKTDEIQKDFVTSMDNQCKRRKIAIEDTIVQKGNVKFADVVGLMDAKQALKEAIIMPIQFPHLFTGGRQPWKRILIYGPPGTGKTRLAQAVASEINSTFYSVSSSDLVSSWVGESEKLIKELFYSARNQQGRSVIFIDEIDSICRKRSWREEEYTRRIKTELLKQMEGANNNSSAEHFILLCATNCPWELDSAFLRRFQKRIYIPLPDREARMALINMHLSTTPALLTSEDWCLLSDKTEGYSGSDLANCTSDAMFEPIRELEKARFWKLNKDFFYTPCAESDRPSTQSCLNDLPPDKVQPRPVAIKDFLKVVSRNIRTVTREDTEKFEQFSFNAR